MISTSKPELDIKALVNAEIEREKDAYAPAEEKPLFTWRGVGRFLDTEPPPQEYIFAGLLPAGIVGAFFAQGGTGKTMLLLQLGISLATGEPFGQFKPTKPHKVLFLGGEDDEAVFHRRIYAGAPMMGAAGIAGRTAGKEELLRKNLEVISLVGENRILTALDQNGMPCTTPLFQKLKAALRDSGVEVLVIDPKSRFDGLNENDNAHGTFFVMALEELVKEFGLTVLFTHHISKNAISNGEVKSMTGRGASSLYDGARWSMSLAGMSEAEANEYGVVASRHVVAATSKGNYSAPLEHILYFSRGEHGILNPENLYMNKLNAMTNDFVSALLPYSGAFSCRELRGGGAKTQKQKADIKALFDRLQPEVKPKDVDRIVENAKRRGLLIEKDVSIGKTKKRVICLTDPAFDRFKNDQQEEEPIDDEIEPMPEPKTSRKKQKR